MHPLFANRRAGKLAAFASVVLFVATVAGVAFYHRHAAASPAGPSATDRQVTVAVTALLRKDHLTRHPLDDEISERWLTMFIKTLDPLKMYFVQADIDEFMVKRHLLDDMARRGDTSFAYVVFDRYLQRIGERAKLVEELLKSNEDFTRDEEMVTDPDVMTYAKTQDEVSDLWRRRLKYDMLVLKSEKEKPEPAKGAKDVRHKPIEKNAEKGPVTGEKAKEKLLKRYQGIAKRMKQTDDDELLEMYLSALTRSYDPHTDYMSPGSLENFAIAMSLNLEGIGAALGFTDGYTVVQKVIPGGPAQKDGRLKPEDKIVGVGQGASGEIVDTVDMKLNDVVKMIRGDKGTIVRLRVIPAGKTASDLYSITRDQIELTDSEARSEVFEEGKKPDGTPYKLGVINLPSFYMDMDKACENAEDFRSTTRDVARLLEEFNEKGVDAVVVDLRHNGGGSLTEAVNVTGLFIDYGPVVQVKDFDGRVQALDDEHPGMVWKGPLVVLCSKFSASASEIFAGAIQDYHRGIIVGDTSTHGKGTVQTLLDLSRQLHMSNALGALKVTQQQFYRPNGDSTQNRGVLADVELPSLTSQYDVGEASLDYAMKFNRIQPARYRKMSMVDRRVIDELKTRSSERRKDSKDFAKVLRNIERYNQQKQKKRVSLNESTFLAERAELNADNEEEKQLEELNDPAMPVVKRDYYFNEVMSIAIDYLDLLKTPPTTVIGKFGSK